MFSFGYSFDKLYPIILMILLFYGQSSIISAEKSINILKNNSKSELEQHPKSSSNNVDNINWCEISFCPDKNYGPQSPYIPCDHLPMDFIECDELIDHQNNETSFKQSGNIGCLEFQGGQHGIYFGSTYCHALSFIECYGNRTFIRKGLPCVRYNGHYFITALLFSVLLGFLGMDRFYLGHIGTAIGKLLTIGGVGIWWIVDIILLITGNLMPEDGSNWMPFV
uniref:TM2 domain-containing protein CG11103-like n=1 Tax=Dermatophagoides pteronyssinus TaxID=6956 RepID=A0A6P6YJ49_DERPT|nr:TM2 domain-containing protein CG11103-like [Dermatophagoides pteronyssinus]